MKRIILCLGIFGWLMAAVNARDLGQWDAVNPEIRGWYQAAGPHAAGRPKRVMLR
jgi:hypothetical protein